MKNTPPFLHILPVLIILLTAFSGQPLVGAETRSGSETAVDPASGAYHFTLAKWLAADGEVDAAAAEFDKAVAAEPDAAYLRLEYAELLAGAQRLGQAADQIERARALAPKSVDVLRAFGRIQMSLGRRDPQAVARALDALEALRREAPGDLQGMVALGQIYQSLERWGDAADVFEELVRRHTDNRQLKRLLIDGLQRAGRQARAKEVLEEVLRLDQESLESRMAQAEIESDKGNHSAAIELLEGAGADQDPQVQGFLALEYLRRASAPRATAAKRQQDLARARALVDAATTSNSPTELVLLRAQILAESGESDLAITALRELLDRRPGEPRPAELLVGILEADGRFDEAAALAETILARPELERGAESRGPWLQTLLRLEARRESWERVIELAEELRGDGDSAEAEQALAWQVEALRKLGKLDRALGVLRKEEKEKGPASGLLLTRVEVLLDMGRRADALEVLARPELAASDHPPTIFRRADLLMRIGEEQAARSGLAERVGEGASFELLVGAGEFYLRRQLYDDSIPFIERALAAAPAGRETDLAAELHFYLGQAHERSGRMAPAAQHFRTVLDLRPDDSQAMNYLGYMWAENGLHLDEALVLITRAVEIDPDNGSYLDSLGWVQYRLGRLQDARVNLERAAELTSGNSTILEHLGDVFLALGDHQGARGAYEKAVATGDQENLEKVSGKLKDLLEPQSR